MIVKQLARYGCCLAMLAFFAHVAVRAEQGEGLTIGIEEKLRQFERKKKDIADLEQRIVVQRSVLKSQVIAQFFFNLDRMRSELKPILEGLEKDTGALEAQLKNQPGILKPEAFADLRSRLDAMKKELPGLLEGNIKYGVSLNKLPDGRTLVRLGPEFVSLKTLPADTYTLTVQRPPGSALLRSLEEQNVLPANACVDCKSYSVQIFSVTENGDANSLVSIGETIGERSNWKDLDIQLSPDWRQIGVYRQEKTDVWTSEFWCLAKDTYERCPGPSNQAPPSPRRIQP